ncbi:MAG: coenzyme F420-0:L-glutamate ligase [Proteobacteria bacterium]|nr:coenzyme F420-0:L-glutamate ligase [Pseudomonadota bacterium]
MTGQMQLTALTTLPMVKPEDDLAVLIAASAHQEGFTFSDGDIVCVAQKIVSKAEGRQVSLEGIKPSDQAIALAQETDKDPRLVQLVLDESTEVMRKKPGVLIVRHRLGFAGIDQSNIEHGSEHDNALLLPVDPDRSAETMRQALLKLTGKRLGVIITDSHNRPWRLGTVGTAIGSAGISVLEDHRGGHDLFGRELKVTLINRADAIAGAATLLMGETIEKIPVVLVHGFKPDPVGDNAAMINRPLADDMFR